MTETDFHSEGFKNLVLIQLQRGHSIKDLAKRYDITPEFIQQLVMEFNHPYLNKDLDDLTQLDLETVRLRNKLWLSREKITSLEQALYYSYVSNLMQTEAFTNAEIEFFCKTQFEKFRAQANDMVYRRRVKTSKNTRRTSAHAKATVS